MFQPQKVIKPAALFCSVWRPSDRHTHASRYRDVVDRLLPSSLVPLLQSETKCETILMKMTLICMKMKLHTELIFI